MFKLEILIQNPPPKNPTFIGYYVNVVLFKLEMLIQKKKKKNIQRILRELLQHQLWKILFNLVVTTEIATTEYV